MNGGLAQAKLAWRKQGRLCLRYGRLEHRAPAKTPFKRKNRASPPSFAESEAVFSDPLKGLPSHMSRSTSPLRLCHCTFKTLAYRVTNRPRLIGAHVI
jgi:hypothetical protein